jgi:hypothetical protein
MSPLIFGGRGCDRARGDRGKDRLRNVERRS